MQHAEGDIAVDGEMAARRRAGRRLALGLLHLAEDAHGALVEGLAFLRQRELARGAVDQPRAEPRLQPGDQLADARRRQAQFSRGRGEAAEIDDADEDLHLGGAVGVETGHVEFTSQMIGLRTF